MKTRIYNEGQLIKERLAEISDYIYNNPELGNEEYKAVEALTTFLKEHNFQVECPIADMDTAFKATFDSGKPGMTIGYLCEYDALPKIGHGCGHNMIGVMSSGAAVALSKVLDEIGGKIIVCGTPAEETNGGKVILAEAGVFDELDAAMIVHPDGETRASGSSSALYPIRFIYKGKTAHAASCPEKGINALNSVIQLFNGIDALRQHVTPDVKMHGIITKGGVAANIVPDEAVADFYFRASTKERVTEVIEKVKKIAEGAALMTGATLEMERYELPYDDLNTNETLSEIFNSNLLFVDKSKMTVEEQRFVNTGLSHIDFLIFNKVTKMPILAIEVDGFYYHRDGTRQAERDALKDHILEVYGLPLLRFKTNGSGEREMLSQKLDELYRMGKDGIPQC